MSLYVTFKFMENPYIKNIGYPVLLAGQEIPPSGQIACFPNLLCTASMFLEKIQGGHLL
jgi:hypothetical protein